MTTLPEIVARARDLVDVYEDLISRAKILHIDVNSQSSTLHSFISRLERVVKETSDFLEDLKNMEYNVDKYYGKYLRTYYNYLIMISIPYLLELLNEIKNSADQSIRQVLDKIIEELNSFTKKYGSTFNNTDKSTP